MKNKNKGFTLIEMIIVLAIMGILSTIVGVGVPAYQRFSDKSHLKTETRIIVQSIQKARTDAVMSGYDYKVWFLQNAKEDKIYIEKLSPDDPPAERIILAENSRIVANTYINANSNLRLKPIGTVSMGGHITLKSPRGEHMTIVVQIGTGRIYMKEGMIDD